MNRLLHWAVMSFVLALVFAVFGFSGLAVGTAGLAKLLFFVFLALSALALVFDRRIPAR